MGVYPFAGGRKAKPTKKHRPVIWECMLGTVYAADPSGRVKYFDYKWDEARTYAGIDKNSDLRVAKVPPHVRYYDSGDQPRPGRNALWAIRK